MLYIVSTPIGNLEDITLRAIRILKEVDIIICEDTRTSQTLLKHYDIKKPLMTFHAYSKEKDTQNIISELKSGKTMALISDAGTPGISDPGYVLIQEAIKHHIPLTPIPGVSAVITALSTSGLPTHQFLYLGFLPIKKGRQTLLNSLKDKKYTVVIYESVHRIQKTLLEFHTYFPDIQKAVVARELTKTYESFYTGTFQELSKHFEENPSQVKGEFVILF